MTKAPNAEVQMIDSAVVRLHLISVCTRREANPCDGRSWEELTTKIHAVVDREGLPLGLALSAS